MTRKELLDALIELERAMASMDYDTEYDSEYQAKNREWQNIYDAILAE